MPDFSLVPVDHQPDFSDFSLIPVDYDPFSADGVTQQGQTPAQPVPAQIQPAQPQQTPTQPPSPPLQPATGFSPPDAGVSAANAQAAAPGNSFRPGLQQPSFQLAQNDQPATEGGVTVKNLDTGSADLSTIPGVSNYPDDAANKAAGESVLAGPSNKQFDTTEKFPGSDTANDQHTVGISGKITDLGNGSFQVTNGQFTIKTVSENGTTTFITRKIEGNAYAIVSQPPNGGPISVNVGSASN